LLSGKVLYGVVGDTRDLRRIREEFDNGREYYALHGQQIITPEQFDKRPDPGALAWHNEHCFKG
jgi:putative restriction endonuclease